MNTELKSKLKALPISPGVYFFYNANGELIYVGKASILRRRVSSYFQKQSNRDVKTKLLISKIASVDWLEASSEIEALFLEAEFIKRNKPIYNVRDKDDKNFIYIKISTDEFPIISYVRRPNDDKAKYYGPFVSSYNVRSAMRYLRRIYPYFTTTKGYERRSALEHQIGVAPKPDTTVAQYKIIIHKLELILGGKTQTLITRLEHDIDRVAAKRQYEQAAQLRDEYMALKALSQKIIFGAEESRDISVDKALSGLTDRLELKSIPRRIEAYDISNFAGGDAVASMIVFTDGIPNQAQYRRFKMRTKGPDDFAMMRETLTRRFNGKHNDWPKPDLILIDGGKGQLTSALAVMSELRINIPIFGLAKKREQIVRHLVTENANSKTNQTKDGREWQEGNFNIIELPKDYQVIALLQRIRDEAHRFAVNYHTSLRDKRIKTSILDTIPGVGPMTRRRLMRTFGSINGVRLASEQELAEVVGKKAKVIKEYVG